MQQLMGENIAYAEVAVKFAPGNIDFLILLVTIILICSVLLLVLFNIKSIKRIP